MLAAVADLSVPQAADPRSDACHAAAVGAFLADRLAGASRDVSNAAGDTPVPGGRQRAVSSIISSSLDVDRTEKHPTDPTRRRLRVATARAPGVQLPHLPRGVTVVPTSRLPLDALAERVGVVRETSSEGARSYGGFTAHQATKFTGCSARQLRYWDQIGRSPSIQGTGGRRGAQVVLVPGPRRAQGRQILLDNGMSLQRVRRAWDYLNRRAALDKHLSEVKLITDGVSIFKIARRNGEIIDALQVASSPSSSRSTRSRAAWKARSASSERIATVSSGRFARRRRARTGR